jgi:hypothetical protein
MGQGKLLTISENHKRRFKLGTMDKKNPKSFYLNLSSWVKPKTEDEPMSLINGLRKGINDTVRKSDLPDSYIVDLDLRESGIRLGKRSFMSCEITFLNNRSGFNTPIMKNQIDELSSSIDSFIMSNTNFDFYAKKS